MKVRFVALVMVAGCSKGLPVKDLDAYDYAIHVETPDAGKTYPESFSLRVNDHTYAVKQGQVTLPKAEMLTGAKVAAVSLTSCGEERLELDNVYNDEKRMRQEVSRYTSQPVNWKLKPHTEYDARYVSVVVDNYDNKAPAKVTLGNQTVEVAANKHEHVGFPLGHCATATQAAIDGIVLGNVKPDAPTLVDVAGNHCYRVKTDAYGRANVGSDNGYQLDAEQPRMYILPRVDNWFTSNGETASVRVKDTPQDREDASALCTQLMHADCKPAVEAKATRANHKRT